MRNIIRQFAAAAASLCALLSATDAVAAAFTSGNILASVNLGRVREYTPSGTLVQELNTTYTGSFTTGLAFDPSGNLLVTNFSSGTITRFDPNGNILAPNPFTSPGGSPESISFRANGQFVVGRASGNAQLYNADGTLNTPLATVTGTDWLDLAADQTTLFYNDENGTIRKLDVNSNTALGTFGSTGTGTSYALRILPNGHVLSAANTMVVEFDAAGVIVDTYTEANVSGLFALNLDPDGTSFWTGSYGNDSIYHFAIGGGLLGSFGTTGSSSNLFGLAVIGEVTQGCGQQCGGSSTGGQVPEPQPFALLVLGFAGLALSRRR